MWSPTSRDWSRPGGVFHALSPFDIATPVRSIWPRGVSRSGRRLVVTVYDLIPELFPDTYLVDPGTRHRYRARRELVRAADHVMTLSRSAADDVADHLGVPDNRITVVGAACSDLFRPGGDPAHEAESARDLLPGLGERTVVYNGAVEPRKNMDKLIRAFAGLPEEVRSRYQLVLVCRLSPLERNHFEVLGRGLGLSSHQLYLTGLVSDTTLVHLYRSAALVVFPSLYEGYGLPVAEAMACGAPVVASGNSALAELVDPEATFDPSDERSIGGAVVRGLLDPSFRQRLVSWSTRPRSTWSDVSERAATVYRSLADGPDRSGPRPPAAWPRRPRVALVTPWPPATTGVASYSRRLARALADHAEVELFLDGDTAAETPADPEFASYPARSLPVVDPARGGYDAVIASVGNSEHHAGALALVRRCRVPAAVLAHDVRLNGLYRHGAARGAVPEGNAAAVTSLYDEADEGWITDGWLQPAEAEAHDVYLARELIGLADPFIVTSDFAAGLARRDARPEDRGRIVVCPYAYPPVAPRPPADEQPGLVCTFGLVNAVKQPELLLAAFALVHRSDETTELTFVGSGRPRPAGAVPRPGDASRGGRGGGLHRCGRRRGVRAMAASGVGGGAAPGRYQRRDLRSGGRLSLPRRGDRRHRRRAGRTTARVRGQGAAGRHSGGGGRRGDRTASSTPNSGPGRAAEGLAFVAARGFGRGARQLLDVLGLAAPPVARPGPS